MWIQRWSLLLKGALSSLGQFLAIESPLKMMKNAFYFTLKTLFVSLSRNLNFCLKILVMYKNGLIWLIPRFMTSQPG